MTTLGDISRLPLDPFVGGQRRQPDSGEVIPTYDAATAEPLCEVPVSDQGIVADAVAAAKEATRGEWSQITPAERGRMLMRVAALIREKADYLGFVESVDSGKPLREAKADIETSARYFEYYAGVADKLQGDTIPLGQQHFSFTVHEPIGVTAHIIPWNFPLVTTARGLAPALAAGATAVVKPAEQTPLTALILADYLADAGIPDGVVNVVCGSGEETGASLVSHPDISHVTFTGSLETGTAVMRSAAEHVAQVTLELGGKSPNVVLADADLNAAMDGVLKGIFTNSGQICSAGSRLVLEEACADEFLDRLLNRIHQFTFGRGLDNPDIGPVISAEQLEKIKRIVDHSARTGSRILTGGKVTNPEGLNGWFYEPTVILSDNIDDIAVQEEIFGPVLTVQIAKDFSHACELAECTNFGLVAGIYTSDLSKALRFSRFVSSGQVFINQYLAGGVETPFGGTKNSGFGREKGLEALRSYYTVKTVTARI